MNFHAQPKVTSSNLEKTSGKFNSRQRRRTYLLHARDSRSRTCRLPEGTRDNSASEESSQNAGSWPQPRAFPAASRTRLCSSKAYFASQASRDEFVTQEEALAVVASCRHFETIPHWRGCRACPVEVGTSEIWNLVQAVNLPSTCFVTFFVTFFCGAERRRNLHDSGQLE